MTIAQTDQRLFKGSTAEILAFMPPSFDGWTYAESTDDNSAYRWNSTTSLWEPLGGSGPADAIGYFDGSGSLTGDAAWLACLGLLPHFIDTSENQPL